MARSSSAPQARRMLALISYVSQEHTKLDLDKLAARFNVSTEEITQDLEKLACCGMSDEERIQLFTSNTEAVIWGSLPALKRAARLSRQETKALLTALQLAGIEPEDALYQKLLQASGALDVDADKIGRLITSGMSSGQGELIKSLSAALADKRVILLYYASPSKEHSELRPRAIEPRQLFMERDSWYLEAWCRRSDELRTFKLERIARIELSEERFEPQAQSSSKDVPQSKSTATLTAHGKGKKGQLLNSIQQGKPAFLVFYTKELPLAAQWPGIRLIPTTDNAAQDAYLASGLADHRQTLARKGLIDPQLDCAPQFFAEIPYLPNSWLARQVLAQRGWVDIVEPSYLRGLVYQMARLQGEDLCNLLSKDEDLDWSKRLP